MRKTVAIVQSSYIPWRGFFDLINLADEFILYDDVQFTKRDWRSRNRIKTMNGAHWLTVPIQVKGKYHQSIKDAIVSESDWGRQHWKILQQNYARAEYFKRYADVFEEVYLNTSETHLSQINFKLIRTICSLLEIQTNISWSMDYNLGDEDKTDRLIALCKQAGGNHYLSGPSAKDYIVSKHFIDAGIELEYMNYEGYREYRQLHPPFDAHVSVLDLIFNEGPNARNFLKTTTP